MNLLQRALAWAALGMPVFTLQPRSKIPLAGSHGCKEASTDAAAIRNWWDRTPDANIGIATGAGRRPDLMSSPSRGKRQKVRRT